MNLTSRPHIPDPNRLIPAACRQELAIRRKCDGSDRVLAGEPMDFLPCCHIPEPNGRFVIACHSKPPAVRRELHRGAEPVGGLELPEFLSRVHVKELESREPSLCPSRRQLLPVGGKHRG